MSDAGVRPMRTATSSLRCKLGDKAENPACTSSPNLRVGPNRLLWGALLFNNLTGLEWTQVGLPRALGVSVSIESVK